MAAEKKKNRQPRRRQEGYLHRSPAIHVTVYDLHGRALPNNVVTEILNTVNDISLKNGLVINFAQT